MRWFGTRGGNRPKIEDVAPVLHTALVRVMERVARCSAARGSAVPVARRELAQQLRESMTAVRDLLGGTSPTPRILRMVQLTTVEIWSVARPWLILDFAIPDRPTVSTWELSELGRQVWSRAEETVAAAREDEPVVARERLTQLLGEVAAFSAASGTVSMSERQAGMWRWLSDEVNGFVSDALTSLPEPR